MTSEYRDISGSGSDSTPQTVTTVILIFVTPQVLGLGQGHIAEQRGVLRTFGGVPRFPGELDQASSRIGPSHHQGSEPTLTAPQGFFAWSWVGGRPLGGAGTLRMHRNASALDQENPQVPCLPQLVARG